MHVDTTYATHFCYLGKTYILVFNNGQTNYDGGVCKKKS